MGVKYDKGKAPVVRGAFRYFPDALEAVAIVSDYGARKYETTLEHKNWQSVPDGQLRYLDADGRHLLREGYDHESGLLHAAHHAWDALASLQLLLQTKSAEIIDPDRGMGPHVNIVKTEGEIESESNN